MSVRLSAGISASLSGMAFVKFDIGTLLRKHVEKLRTWLKSGNNIYRFTRTLCFILLSATCLAQQYRERSAVLPWQRFLGSRSIYFNNKKGR
jgi:hypothetical protein